MNRDPASLENLHDIVQPVPVSWWPIAPGWWILLSLLVFAVLAIAVVAWRLWRANAYRRTALRELQGTTSADQMAEILKRTALAVFPRSDVASLSGAAWSDWLSRTAGVPVSHQVREMLTRGVFATPEPSSVNELQAFATYWIRHHRRPPG